MPIQHNHPLLYPKDEWKPGVNLSDRFKTYGYGVINNVIESTITESNEEYSLEMDVHTSCNVFNELVKYNIILANGQLFRIKDTSFDSEEGIKNVYAEHITYDLNFDEVYDLKYDNSGTDCITNLHSRAQYKNYIITSNLGRYKLHKTKLELDAVKVLDAIDEVIEKLKEGAGEQGDVIDVLKVRDNNKIAYYLDDITNNTALYGTNTNIRLDISKIKKVEITENDEDFCTKVIAKGKDNIVVKDITHPTIGNAGLPFWITKVVSFSDDNVEATIRKKGQAYIITKSMNIKNIKVDMGEIASTDFYKKLTLYKDLKLFDKVMVKHPYIADTYVDFKIVKIERDVNGNLKTLEFGELNNDIIKRLKKTVKNTAQKIINDRLNSITATV